MASHSENLGLILPYEREYFNINTWNSNMRVLDEAYALLKNQSGQSQPIAASLIQYDNTNSGMAATNLQTAMDELVSNNIETNVYEIYVTQDEEIEIATWAHIYIVLHFGNTVPNVTFVQSMPGSGLDFHWEGGQPIFQANKTYELSFLRLDCKWVERD